MKYIALKNNRIISIFEHPDTLSEGSLNGLVCCPYNRFNAQLKVGDYIDIQTGRIIYSDPDADRVYKARQQDFPDIQELLLALHKHFKATNTNIGGFTDRIDELLAKHPHPRGQTILQNPDTEEVYKFPPIQHTPDPQPEIPKEQ